MNAERLQPAGSKAVQEPVILRTESFEMHIPQTLAKDSGIVSSLGDTSDQPKPAGTVAGKEQSNPTMKPAAEDATTTKTAVKTFQELEKERMQKVFGVGDYSPYSKEYRPMKWEAFQAAQTELITNPGSFFRNFGKHMRNIDTDFRGGRDLGGAKERLERSGELVKMIALFTMFDYVTSKPFELLFPVKKGSHLSVEEVRKNARNSAFKKLTDVMNDKYATALGNMYVEKQTGKRGFIHEVADKGADTIQTGYPKTEDWVNGATLESYIRLVSQIPVAGALFEQVTAGLARWQEKSSLHTATGKMVYMGLGVLIRENRVAGKMAADEIAEAVARTLI